MSATNPHFDLRLATAVSIGKIGQLASRQLGFGGGTALPGVVADRIDNRALAKLVRGLNRGVVLVTGTNGKTTTCRLLAASLTAGQWKLVHNRAGANLHSGLLTALISQVQLNGRTTADGALFEVDEAVMPSVELAVQPRVIVLTNLFRDQLDRYGEIDHVASVWKTAIARLPPSTTLILNADDPALAALGQQTAARVLYYGIDEPGEVGVVGHVADTKNCPRCGLPLVYSAVRYAHLGDYHCPTGHFDRPRPDIAARSIVAAGVEATDLELTGPFGVRQFRLKLPGLYNVYNLLAAVAAATDLDIPIDVAIKSMSGVDAAFGRLERIAVGNRLLFFALIKNPIGFSEVLRMILEEPGDKDLAIFINDNLADGTDVSWLWDAEVERLSSRVRSIVVGGTRGGDMAIRLKYAGVPADRIAWSDSIAKGLDDALANVPSGCTLFVLPTYTAMLELRTLLGKRNQAPKYWEG